ncbi:hypothetical protein FQN54_005518 [Arachnomyces sp. PD_36]|nr:hypothetical protein FQN54_005518 [Arachnomyces sp. PD_36]
MDAGGRPQCGSPSSGGDDYDLPLHVAALFLVLGFSILGCGFPVVAKKLPKMKIPPSAFFFCKHFGTGVLVATAFVHLLPTAFSSLNNPCLPPLFTEQYPAMPGVIMLASLFSLFLIELWLNSKTGGHSHGGATGESLNAPPPRPNPPGHQGDISWPKQNRIRNSSSQETLTDAYDEKGGYKAQTYEVSNDFDSTYEAQQSEMPAWFMAFYEQYVREREKINSMLQAAVPQATKQSLYAKEIEPPTAADQDLEAATVDPQVLRKMSLNITLLEGGILFHSVFVGMTVSLETEGFIVLLIAILFHQAFEGLGLGSRIAAVPYPKGSIRPWVLVIAFGTTAPIGQAIGLMARSSYDPESAFALILVGAFNAISSGLLIYAALVDLLAEDFLSEEGQKMTTKQKSWGFAYILLGAVGMSIVGAFA